MSSHCYMLQKKLQLQILQLCLAHYSFYTCTYMYILYQEVGTILLYRKIVSDMIKSHILVRVKMIFILLKT